MLIVYRQVHDLLTVSIVLVYLEIFIAEMHDSSCLALCRLSGNFARAAITVHRKLKFVLVGRLRINPLVLGAVLGLGFGFVELRQFQLDERFGGINKSSQARFSLKSSHAK